jgi:hypothetical protein
MLMSDRYNHADMKVDLEHAVLHRPQQLWRDRGEGAVIKTRFSHDRMATRDATLKRKYACCVPRADAAAG